MSPSLNFYRALDEALARPLVGIAGFSECAQVAPVRIPEWVFAQRRNRLKDLRLFFEVTLKIFHAVIAGQFSPMLCRFLFNNVPECFGLEFHKRLPAQAWTIPTFFRTDESKNGKIFEIQCPGSGWGDLQLLSSTYTLTNSSVALNRYCPSQAVSREIINLVKKDSPSVLHLLDNSSNPISMRFLIATTQPPLRYWGYESSVRNDECDFIRSHSFFGLVNENLFNNRLASAGEGKVIFDLPPVLVFDQKAPLCLPFLEETREFFTDTIRDVLTYSYPVQENGFRDVDGTWVGVQEFVSRPASRRKYFLKYAGCDVSTNWGSRAVFRLNDSKAGELIKRAVQDARRDRFWLIQPEISEKETVRFFERSGGDEREKKMTIKYSCFYGPTELIGLRTMHRNHYKVHGQKDTVVGVAIPGLFEETSRSE
jgi:hypothetical protein